MMNKSAQPTESDSGGTGTSGELTARRRYFAIVGVVLGCIGGLTIALSVWPVPKVVSVTGKSHTLVPETAVTTETFEVSIGQESKHVELEVPYQSVKPVWETLSREVETSRLAVIQGCVIAGIAIFFGIYAGLVLSLWAYDNIAGSRTTKKTNDNERRLRDLVGLAAGVVMGIVAAADFDVSRQTAELEIEIESQNRTVQALEESMARLAADSMPRSAVLDIVRTLTVSLGAEIKAEPSLDRVRHKDSESLPDVPVPPAPSVDPRA